MILSGGSHTADSHSFPAGFIEWVEANGLFVLGICHGIQLILQSLGGEVRVGENQEYGEMEIRTFRVQEREGYKAAGGADEPW